MGMLLTVVVVITTSAQVVEPELLIPGRFYSPVQKHKEEWVQALGAVISEFVWV